MDQKNLKRSADGRWTIDVTIDGRRTKRIIGGKRDAEGALSALRTDAFRGQYGVPREKADALFEDHAKEFLELYCKQNKRSWVSDRTSLSHLKEFFKGKHLGKITALDVESYKAKRKADQVVQPARRKKKSLKEPRLVSPSTINRELACLKTLFNKAVEWEKLDVNPAAKIKKFREPNAMERILTIAESKRLLDESSDELRPVLIVALNTGMRKNEILSLRWKDVDFVKGFIHVADSKSGRSRDIPMNAVVFDLLRQFPPRIKFVFENSLGTCIRDVKTAFHGGCRRAEIHGVRFHDLRHTAASRMVERGIDLVTVSKILGHSSIQMTMRYAHPTPENMRLAVAKLGEDFKQTRKKPVIAQVAVPVNASKTCH